jgi:hypothetical protein
MGSQPEERVIQTGCIEAAAGVEKIRMKMEAEQPPTDRIND